METRARRVLQRPAPARGRPPYTTTWRGAIPTIRSRQTCSTGSGKSWSVRGGSVGRGMRAQQLSLLPIGDRGLAGTASRGPGSSGLSALASRTARSLAASLACTRLIRHITAPSVSTCTTRWRRGCSRLRDRIAFQCFLAVGNANAIPS